MRRQLTDAVNQNDLPEITQQQQNFVQEIVAGKTATDAYKSAYDASNMLPRTIWAEASRLRHNPGVAAWIAAAYRARLGNATVSLQQHITRLEELREIAIASGNIGAAVQAEQLIGKATGHYTERMEVAHHDLRDELSELAKISPELAAQFAKEKGVNVN